MANVYIDMYNDLRIKRAGYSWDVNDKEVRKRLRIRLLKKDITYQEYQEAITLLAKGGYIK